MVLEPFLDLCGDKVHKHDRNYRGGISGRRENDWNSEESLIDRHCEYSPFKRSEQRISCINRVRNTRENQESSENHSDKRIHPKCHCTGISENDRKEGQTCIAKVRKQNIGAISGCDDTCCQQNRVNSRNDSAGTQNPERRNHNLRDQSRKSIHKRTLILVFLFFTFT